MYVEVSYGKEIGKKKRVLRKGRQIMISYM
jgi:hypothetical protein